MRKVSSILLMSFLAGSCAKLNSRADADCKDGSTSITKVWGDPAPARVEASYNKLSPLPTYPPEALAARVTGAVFLHVWIPANFATAPDNVTVEQVFPSNAGVLLHGLTDLARGWKFNPLEFYGKPVASEAIIPVTFNIKGYAPPPSGEKRSPLPKGVAVMWPIIEVEGALPKSEPDPK